MTSTYVEYITQDTVWKLYLMVGLILTLVVWKAWTSRREDARIERIAQAEAGYHASYVMDRVNQQGRAIERVERVLDYAAADPEQEAIDAAIAESEAEEHQAHVMLGRRMVV